MRFKNGDYVSIIKKDRYAITDKDSFGIIVKKFSEDNCYEVNFIYTTGKRRRENTLYNITESDLDYCYQLIFDLR